MSRRVKSIHGVLYKKSAHHKYLCVHCLKSGKGNPCGVEGHTRVHVSHRIRFPSPNASRTRWKEFFKNTRFHVHEESERKTFTETVKTLKGIDV